jgi:hypothetical protein
VPAADLVEQEGLANAPQAQQGRVSADALSEQTHELVERRELGFPVDKERIDW